MRQQGHGRIVNCSSVLGFTPMKWRGAYVSTKFALEGLTQTLRLEMQDTPIHISLIQPGPITSDIRQNSIAHFEKWIDWRGSVRSDQYQGTLLKRLYESRGPDRFELPASAVTIKLAHALEAKRPRLNYYVTRPTYMMATLRRLLPARVFEWIVAQG
jgi:short-subunit dehydrogenase